MYDIDCIGTLCTPFVLRPSNYDESVIDFIDISYSDIEYISLSIRQYFSYLFVVAIVDSYFSYVATYLRYENEPCSVDHVSTINRAQVVIFFNVYSRLQRQQR